MHVQNRRAGTAWAVARANAKVNSDKYSAFQLSLLRCCLRRGRHGNSRRTDA
jgi:hypothetical protein